ncbi:ABC transporter permease subunit [Actinomadura sp. 3N407]|uniref:ABC transporter permease subunit n=1 Tax=Actinomadura sp. 3N407 TaxID=3457423 RepID=UPI003FCEBD2B
MSHVMASVPRPGFTDLLRSEWTKVRTLRSTHYTLLAFLLIGVGLSAAIGVGNAVAYPDMTAQERADFSPLVMSLYGVILSQLALATLGITVVTGEYATGMMGLTLAAAPRRGRLLAAKAIVFTAVVLIVGVIGGLAMFATAQAIFAGQDMPYLGPDSLGEAGVLRAVVGVGLYCAALGLLALAIGTLVRWTAGAVGALVGLIVLVPSMGGALPAEWAAALDKYWPTNAGLQLVLNGQDGLPPWSGFGLMCTFVAAMLTVAFVVFRRRDV